LDSGGGISERNRITQIGSGAVEAPLLPTSFQVVPTGGRKVRGSFLLARM
jgi:hypothetical protein